MIARTLPLLTLVILFAGPVRAQKSSCGAVEVDCKDHKFKINGQEKGEVGCGSGRGGGGGPNSQAQLCKGDGKTGDCQSATIGAHHSGEVVKDGMEINSCPGMGASGGEKILHVGPVNVDATCGCVAFTQQDYDTYIKPCQGSKLVIHGNGGSQGSSSSPTNAPSTGGATTAHGG